MSSSDYWIDFWKNNKIIKKENPQEKIGRTINGVPISSELWQETLLSLKQHLALNESDVVLDIGAGSGMITIPFSNVVKQVTAVDVSGELLQSFNNIDNVIKITGDINTIDFEEESFSKIIFYFAIQHFSLGEVIGLFEKIFKWLKKGGTCYIGDIPDLNRQFNFFNNKDRLTDYFGSIKTQKPIIGTWFDKEFLIQLGRYTGFSKAEVIDQPSHFINSHYRFDFLLSKPAEEFETKVKYTYTITHANLYSFLEQANYLFNPPLSGVVNIEAYSQKLYKNSRVVVANCDDKPVGILAFYTNAEEGVAFIPYICVLKEVQKLKIAKTMYELFEAIVVKEKQQTIKLEVYRQNIHVLKFYYKLGFELFENINEQKVSLIKTLK